MSYIDDKIIEMRRSNSYITTIQRWVVGALPMLDEQVCLARVLSVLDRNNIAVSQKEVRSAFNKFYHKEFHGEKQGYLSWLYNQFHVKSGTLVNSANVRSVPNKKDTISVTTEPKEADSVCFSQSSVINPTKYHKAKEIGCLSEKHRQEKEWGEEC